MDNNYDIMSILANYWQAEVERLGLDNKEKANRAEMMDEAVERMKMLGLSSEFIEEFQNNGHLNFGMERGRLFQLNDFEKNQIRELEGNEESLVYTVVRNDSSYGRMVYFIMVTRHKCDWGREREMLKEKNIVTAYVYNLDIPIFSELGLIEVKTLPGGMLDLRMATDVPQLRPSHRGLCGIRKDDYPLPEELRKFNYYYPDAGHVVMAIPESLLPRATESGNFDDYECPIPCRYILAKGYRFLEGYVVCDAPYDKEFGVSLDESWYDE